MNEIQEEFRTKKIEINANLSSDVKDLLKCVLRRNPDQRFNIRQVLQHPAIQSRIEEFGRPISEDQYALLITSYMQNCGMSNKRDHPVEIKKYKESHRDFEAEAPKGGESSGGFFDDISIQFPPSNYYGPMPTPFFGNDPGFFDNIPENLSFKKSRQDTQRGDSLRGEVQKLRPPVLTNGQNSQPSSLTRDSNGLMSGLELRKADSLNVSNPGSSRGITILANNEYDKTGSSRNIYVGQNNMGSFSNINYGGQQLSSQNVKTEAPKQDAPAVVSIKKIGGDLPSMTYLPPKPEASKTQPSNYQTDSKLGQGQSNPIQGYQAGESRTLGQNNLVQTPQAAKAEIKPPYQLSQYDSTNKFTYDSIPPYNPMPLPGSASNPTLNYKSAKPDQGSSTLPPPAQLKTLQAPLNPTSTTPKVIQNPYRPLQTQDHNSVTFVNYHPASGGSFSQAKLQTAHTTHSEPHTHSQTTIKNDYQSPEQAQQAEVRYFPYEIQEGNVSSVHNTLNEQFERQEDNRQARMKTQPANVLQPEYKPAAKTFSIDLRPNTSGSTPSPISTPLSLASKKPADPLPSNRPTSYSSPANNVMFVNHVHPPTTQINYSSQAPGQTRTTTFSYQEEKKMSQNQEPKHYGAVLPLPGQNVYPLTTFANESSSKPTNIKYVDYNSSNGRGGTDYGSTANQVKSTNYSIGEQLGIPSNAIRTSSFIKPQTRPGSIEKPRESSADLGRVFGKQYVWANQK